MGDLFNKREPKVHITVLVMYLFKIQPPCCEWNECEGFI